MSMQQRDLTRAVLAVLLVAVLSFALIACVIGGGLYAWAHQQGLDPLTAIRLRVSLAQHNDDLKKSAGTDMHYQEFVVRPGDTAYTIAANLHTAGLITDADLFVDYVRYYRLDSQLEAGTFFLQQTQTIEQIAYALTDASTASIPFQTLGGWRLEEIAETAIDGNPFFDFSGNDFLNVVGRGAVIPADFKARIGIPDVLSDGKPASLEGFMYPGEYKLQPGITADGLRDALLAAFDVHVTPDLYAKATARGLTMYQVVTLASIVQREAVQMDEAPLIASVYLNRLARSMKLDADPTVQYAIGFRDGRWWPRLSGEADYYALGSVQPEYAYNTYLKSDGSPIADLLPPGPIASPGLAAIQAVLDAPATEYLYFRSCNDLTHQFSTTLEQHNSIVCPQ